MFCLLLTPILAQLFFLRSSKSLLKEKKKPQQQVFEGTKETPITIDATIDADENRLKMTQIANEGFSKAKEEWEKNFVVMGYARSPSLFLLPFLIIIMLLLFPFLLFSYLDKRQEKLRTEAAEASTSTCSAGPTPTSH